jgi:hypothetical protein
MSALSEILARYGPQVDENLQRPQSAIDIYNKQGLIGPLLINLNGLFNVKQTICLRNVFLSNVSNSNEILLSSTAIEPQLLT